MKSQLDQQSLGDGVLDFISMACVQGYLLKWQVKRALFHMLPELCTADYSAHASAAKFLQKNFRSAPTSPILRHLEPAKTSKLRHVSYKAREGEMRKAAMSMRPMVK